MSSSAIGGKNDVLSLGLLLIDGFALMSYAAVVEPFRAANILSGSMLYRWINLSPDGAAVTASSGAAIVADHALGDSAECDMLFVFAAGDPAGFRDAATFRWLRRFAARGTDIVGVSGGAYLLARAGLLDGYRATIHWEHAAAFREEFPALAIGSDLYVIDRTRMTCAGGTAGLDLAVDLIERAHGPALAGRVGEWFIRTEPRSAGRSQRSSLRERYGISDGHVLRALAVMEANVETPQPRAALAAAAGSSLRQLERSFATLLGRTIGDAYLAIRLDHAARLLRSTDLAVTEIAVMCGFQSASHFSRRFKAYSGVPPKGLRRRRVVPAEHDIEGEGVAEIDAET